MDAAPHVFRSLLCLALAPCLLHCGGARQQVVQLDPIEFKVDRSGGGHHVYVRDFATLTDEAMARYHAGEWAEAVRLFDLLVREYPAEPGIAAVQHNAGLALLRLGRPADAAQRFADVQRRSKGTRDARDALFLYAEAIDAAGQPQAAADTLRGALDDAAVQADIGGPLGVLDQLEAAARMGLALRRALDPTHADEAFKRVERIYNDHRDVQVVAESEWVARSLYERGEIYRELFASIHFKLPVERMKRDLEDKANLFLKAENAYFHCVRLHHRTWSLAAGFEIGHLYSQLVDDIDHAEAPPELDALTVEVYRDELWNHTERLAKRGIAIHRQNVALAGRLGEKDSDWAARSEEQIGRLEKMIEVATQRRARLNDPKALPLPAETTPTAK